MADATMAEKTEPIANGAAVVEHRPARVSDFSRPCDKGDKCWIKVRPPSMPLSRPGCVLVQIPSRLYDGLCKYWEGLGITPLNFPAGEDPDKIEVSDRENTKLLPAWILGNGKAEVEVSVDTICRAFLGLDAEFGGTTATMPPSVEDEASGDEVEHSPAVYLESVVKRLPDAQQLFLHSPGFSQVPVHQSHSRERQFYEWCRARDSAFANVEECYMQLHPSVMERIDHASGAKRIINGLPSDSHIIGFSGTGKLYVVTREFPSQMYHIYRLDVALPDDQIKDGMVMERDEKDGKEKPNVDPHRVWPRFQEVTTEEGPLSFARAPVLTAVSSQIGLGASDMLALLVPVGEARDEYDLVFVLLPFGSRPVVRSVVPPTRGYVPSILAVSNESAAVICVDAKDPAGAPYPPHVWVIPLQPTSALGSDHGHSHFVIGDAFAMALRAPVMKRGEECEGSVSFSCAVYDETDPHALVIGTTDGGVLRYHIKDAATVHVSPVAVYFSHETPREIEIANRSVDRGKALKNVGRMRAPVLWAQASNTTLGGTRVVDEYQAPTNVFDCTVQRLVASVTTGHAWSLGDRSRVANEVLVTRKMRPVESRVTDAPSRCCVSRGSTAAFHVMIPDSVLIIDMRTGLVRGAFENPNDTTAQRMLKPGETVNERPFSSLWMDLGRIVVCHTSGNVSFIRKATQEMLEERDRQRKARAAELEERMKQIEEETAKMSVNTTGESETGTQT